MQASGDILTALYTRVKLQAQNEIGKGQDYEIGNSAGCAEQKKISLFTYTEEDGCGSLDFMFRGLSFHVWEYHDDVWGAETNIYEAGRSIDVEGGL